MSPSCYLIAVSLGDSAIAQHFVALAEELKARGHQVVVLSPRGGSAPEGWGTNPTVLRWPSRRPNHLRDAVFLWRALLRYRPCCTIANFGAVGVTTLVGALARVPCRVAWYRTLSSQISADTVMPRWKAAYQRSRKRCVYRLCTHVVPNSDAASDDIHRTYQVPERKCHVFANALSDPYDCGGPSPSQGIVVDRFVCAGRFSPSKGQDVVINALTLLAASHPTLSVEFLGGGATQTACQQLAEDLGVAGRCVFRGSVPHDEVLSRMASAAAVLVPSRDEAFGWVNAEALSVGTPVIASAVGGIPEIVEDGVCGFLVPPEDPIALADRMGRIATEPGLRERMSSAARQRFLTRFEQRGAVRRQADWFESIVAASRR